MQFWRNHEHGTWNRLFAILFRRWFVAVCCCFWVPRKMSPSPPSSSLVHSENVCSLFASPIATRKPISLNNWNDFVSFLSEQTSIQHGTKFWFISPPVSFLHVRTYITLYVCALGGAVEPYDRHSPRLLSLFRCGGCAEINMHASCYELREQRDTSHIIFPIRTTCLHSRVWIPTAHHDVSRVLYVAL